jgi:hypothetical protein
MQHKHDKFQRIGILNTFYLLYSERKLYKKKVADMFLSTFNLFLTAYAPLPPPLSYDDVPPVQNPRFTLS